MLPLDWDRVNRQMRTNRKVRVPDEEHGTALCGLHWTIPRFGQTKGAVKGTAFCGMIQTHLVRADSEELSQVILHQWNEQTKTKVRPFNF